MAVGQVRISGKITDKLTYQPVNRARISTLNSKDSTPVTAPRDVVGNYTCNKPPMSSLSNYVEYKLNIQKITLESIPVNANFQMKSSEIILVEIEIMAEIVVLKGGKIAFKANKYATTKKSEAN